MSFGKKGFFWLLVWDEYFDLSSTSRNGPPLFGTKEPLT
jgi:hypothetical protein